MPLNTARRSGLVDQVIEQVRASVTSGEWPIGHRIPNEAVLVEALGVGRNTVREAVRALAHAGLLDVRQGDGTYVRATSEVSGALRRLCGAELRDVLQVRRALEVEGARLAAAHRTETDLAELRSLLDRRDDWLRAGDDDEFARADTAFHLATVRSSHNAILVELYRGLIEAITASVAATHETTVDTVDHRELLAHIASGDVDAAGTAAGELIDRFLAALP
ncbi:GntR family transcriptional regulator [Mycolicibacterium madagascariense]|uniref:GntR family transcriptional regulator n=1 Tax=Mycolicibacterium madagascariense TaxID=212765 RepID=A0A7I7XBE3_9MYCO|nr:FadR/GntR family transcriptional regulator [Mycolicibacterium madagascariense]MCV7014915.1 FadR family transcriptional regulator [Mycolicibacterium madagascariense]BBZ26625.1 GntR family transcriptional regulator [Mycolicibacterium madagascariense]